ncbi:MAG: ABC transporter permease [Acidimicrobiia bacterium]
MTSRTFEIARVDFLRRFRNRSALITAFLAPLALALVFGFLVGGATESSFRIGVVDADGTDTTSGLVASLLEPDQGSGEAAVTFESLADESAARAAVDDGDVDAAMVLPSGFTAAATSGQSTEVLVLRSPDRLVSGQVANAIASSIAGNFRRVDVAVRALVAVAGEPPTAEAIAAASAQPAALSLVDAPAGDRSIDASAFYGAGMSILFLFFTVGFAGRSVLAEQHDGTLARVFATPTSPAEVLAGKTLSVTVLAIAGFVTVWITTTWVFDADWGDVAAVICLIVVTVLAIGGVSTFAASLAHTERQADSVTGIITFVLALLGGNFVGPAAPRLLRRLSLLTPNGWALRGFGDLSADTIGVGGVLLPIGALLGFAALFGSIGLIRLHRRIAA